MVLQKKSLRITIAILLIIVLTLALCALIGCFHFINPFHRSDESIKSWIKEQLPVGTDKEAVRAWLAQYPELETNEYDSGYFLSEDYTLTEEERREDGRVGVTRICASTSYQYLFVTHVDIFFGFDENDRLVDVGVRSDTDSF